MNSQQFKAWCQQVQVRSTDYQTPLLMGILNITPDSFSDGGCYFNVGQALAHARQLISAGADILDVGGESSRPGAKPISSDEEMGRVIPIIEQLRNETDCCISIDTTKASVMQAAIEAGADIINDISALRDEATLTIAAKLQTPVCLMHMKGIPETMQAFPIYYDNIISEINEFFQNQIVRCMKMGIKRENIILDPGFGFGKSVQHNLQIVNHLLQFKQHHLPLMLGVSRKNTIGAVLNKKVDERVIGGLAINIVASLKGLDIIRTHNVEETKQALVMLDAIMQVNNNFKGNME